MILAAILVALTAPFLVFIFALARGALLFWPTMVVLGALHTYIPAVPALGWQATFLLVTALGLLIPTDSGLANTD